MSKHPFFIVTHIQFLRALFLMFANIDRTKSQSIVKTQATIARWLTAFLAIALQTAAP